MVILTIVMLRGILVCDTLYLTTIIQKIAANVITESSAGTEGYRKILLTKSLLTGHLIMLDIATILTLTLPIYQKWIRKINTSIEVEETAEMEAIDISGE